MKTSLLAFLLFIISIGKSQEISWLELEPGLEYASIQSPVKSSHADSKIDVLKIDPGHFNFNLLCAGEKKSDSKTADKWCDEYKMTAGVNASMFKLEGDFKQSTGYLKNGLYTNNNVLNPSYKNVFVFNSSKARIADLSCENWETLKTTYKGFSQSLRMLDCEEKNTWQLQQKKWSMVLLGEDKTGNILFLFVRSPYKVHDYINILKSLPLSLTKLMYLEGGPEASLYINHPKLKLAKQGSYETGFNENDNNKVFWDIPNMITISRK